MALQCGIIGLPNAGKSTIFNALTASQVPAESYPFCTIDPNVGVVPVPDERLERLVRIYQPGKTTPATVEFVDIAGLVRGASKGEGLGNQFLARIREVHALIHVVHCFENPDITHVEGGIDPVRDVEIVATELLLKDLESVEKRLAQVKKSATTGDKEAQAEAVLLQKVLQELNSGHAVHAMDLSPAEFTLMDPLHLLTNKPVLYVANVGEEEMEGEDRSQQIEALFNFAAGEGNRAIRLCGQLEQEISLLEESERKTFVGEYHLREAGLEKLIHAAYELLGYQTCFTCNPNEAHAWTFHQGATAYDIAGMVHTDFQRGFIKAEVFHFKDLERFGSEKAVRDAGLAGFEGKDYRVQDGDVIYFKTST
jgi:GTP-binding protein YchF